MKYSCLILAFLCAFNLQAQSLFGIHLGTAYYPKPLVNAEHLEWDKNPMYLVYGLNAGLPLGKWLNDFPMTLDGALFYSQKKVGNLIAPSSTQVFKNQNLNYHLVARYYFSDGKDVEGQFYTPYIGLGIDGLTQTTTLALDASQIKSYYWGPQLSFGAQFLVIGLNLKGGYLIPTSSNLAKSYYVSLTLGLGI